MKRGFSQISVDGGSVRGGLRHACRKIPAESENMTPGSRFQARMTANPCKGSRIRFGGGNSAKPIFDRNSRKNAGKLRIFPEKR